MKKYHPPKRNAADAVLVALFVVAGFMGLGYVILGVLIFFAAYMSGRIDEGRDR
jgi:hypothetical protein